MQTRNNKIAHLHIAQWVPYIIIGITLLALILFVPEFFKYVIAKILIFSIFAMSLDLLYGYTGLMCLGQAAFFGVGGYAAGILMTRYGIHSFWLVTPISILTIILVAAIFGFIALKTKGLIFLFVTLALGQITENVAQKWRSLTGGSNGLVGIHPPDFGLPWLNVGTTSCYILIVFVFVVSLLLMYRLTRSPFGEAMQGIRDDEGRMAQLGYNTWLYQYIIFIIGGLFAGIAGILFGHLNGFIAPMHLSVTTSAMALLMVIMGGKSTIFGPVIGAATITILELISSIYVPERWPLVLGSVFVLVVIFIPEGISAEVLSLWNRLRCRYGSIED